MNVVLYNNAIFSLIMAMASMDKFYRNCDKRHYWFCIGDLVAILAILKYDHVYLNRIGRCSYGAE